MNKSKKILVLGSGSLKIGEAGEFDYSGSQCLKALKEEGIKTVLVNPNIATIQTSEGMADKIYFLPVTPYFVEKVIEKEKPNGIMLSFGGQTALNCGVELSDKGILEKHNVKVLGTQIETIKNTEDRKLFIKKLNEINLKTPESQAVYNVEQAIKVADKLKYPVMLRVAYALGGQGSGVAINEKELRENAKRAFAYSDQALIEEYLGGWKEVEYEVVRDSYDNCITVCNMENFDPMGIHTGESIVVAPSQTLTNKEYHKLRDIAIKVIRHLGIVGECNIQYALDTNSEDYRIIEVNARLSRSSALASKATGYPLAFVAAKLALGFSLIELENMITKVTKSCFEPALDYVVIKIPRWDLEKFKHISFEIGSEMKSVGEVMAIGRKFEEAVQKAIRMLTINLHGLVGNRINFNNIENELKNPTDKRLFVIVEAIKKGISIDEIHNLTKIDKWFLYKIKNVVDTENELKKYGLENAPKETLKLAKQQGFSDFQVARCLFKEKAANMTEKMLKVRELRKKHNIIPVVNQIDTLAAEFPAKTNYLYLTYNGDEDDIDFKNKKSVVVLGSGAYRIGSSVEFDWCCVNAVFTLKKLGYSTIMLNYNPETVSTDYDVCDRLYFDELSFERVLDIYEKESPLGVIISMGGQIPNNLATKLHKQNVKILGTSPSSIDNAENRHKFSALLDKLNVDQPEWIEAKSIEEADKFAEKVEYPILIRPSYVLSGAAMSIASNKKELEQYLKKAADVSKEHPVVISKFITNAKEIEIDAVAQNGEVKIYAISEHIENAGVHSGDATMALPPQFTYLETMRRIKEIAKEIAKELKITGPFNIQFIAKQNQIKVIECNLRASRSFPFVSKVTKYNFIDMATKSMLDVDISGNYNTLDLDYVGVKAPQFSFSRLHGADPISSVEMASTGEVACLGNDLNEAFLKSLLSVGFKMPKANVLLSAGPIKSKAYLLESIKKLVEMGFKIYATEGTAKFLDNNKVKNEVLQWPLDKKEPNALTYLKERKIDLVINIPKSYEEEELTNDYLIRRKAVDFNIPLLTNAQVAKLFIDSISKKKMEDLEIKSWDGY
ncbi:carbamoyl phosphate synthase large subunit [Candidatus Woesearchaeota archaeon]|jgi:carbamoyl-phosphate synthase large subunit|nr:carbamoyl phosphate synthase large subunit [Candidatus Woesearchaeota archaeon]MDP6648215.1 carbamoyl-phosphate synthase (glutamine-hydrolyzing) large subunit [Candidatus Woesearchaeota archaeon]|tara:strand:- start:27999 stop:31202 length:3204 start_codon:yes stop_codon:yes gene_type:complete